MDISPPPTTLPSFMCVPLSPSLAAALGPLASRPNLTNWNNGDEGTEMKGGRGGGTEIQYCDWAKKKPPISS